MNGTTTARLLCRVRIIRRCTATLEQACSRLAPELGHIWELRAARSVHNWRLSRSKVHTQQQLARNDTRVEWRLTSTAGAGSVDGSACSNSGCSSGEREGGRADGAQPGCDA